MLKLFLVGDYRLARYGRMSFRKLSASLGTHKFVLCVVWLAFFVAVLDLRPCLGADTVKEPGSIALNPNALRPNDLIWVKVYQEDDLEAKTSIDKNGLVTLPLLGAVLVAHKTPSEAAAFIQSLYAKDYLVNPQVSLAVVEKAKLRFTVMGQVQKPGSYEFPDNEPLNLLQGIAIAGGYTRLGAPTKITLQRLQNGKPVIYNLNAELMSKDKKNKPFELLPEDMISVGERVF
jgi:polysaccharide export outer membrane protein